MSDGDPLGLEVKCVVGRLDGLPADHPFRPVLAAANEFGDVLNRVAEVDGPIVAISGMATVMATIAQTNPDLKWPIIKLMNKAISELTGSRVKRGMN